ncbi:hypothetical protein [Sphingobium chungbukense]|uniref:Phytanoyl-CoA dioxygenase n=1 Tax=Sphingobium chungbukense TaxID=56193 RepID=A0A0M3ANB4_9SPHN|nr:hypothetical protein [Sphingobium chungbukense]KKW90426.1 hypothetical protein YP76_20795 [Sphingobium chungbukense]
MYTVANPPFDPIAFHTGIYRGEIFKFERLAAASTLIAFTRELLEAELHPFEPPLIHRHFDQAGQVEMLARCEKAFSGSREVRDLWRDLFEAAGCAPDRLARDRLHLRFQPHHDAPVEAPRERTTATIAFHRDTWGSNLYAQTNWWAPVYPITAGRTFAFFPELWDRPVRNTSADFDLKAVLERSHALGRNAVDADQAIPHLAEEMLGWKAAPVVIEPGTVIAFSSAHAHAGVGNRTGLTRISLETRTIWIDDLLAGRGAPNVDGHARWQSPGLFRRVSDDMPLHHLLGCDPVMRFDGARPPAISMKDTDI